MPSYKLLYFDVRGRAEPARMMFALKGQAFEDTRLPLGSEEWTKLKVDPKQCPLGQLPVLFIDGQSIPQSSAIIRHLAREFGFYGENNKEATQIDVIGETMAEVFQKLIPIYTEKDEDKKKTMAQEFKGTSTKPLFTFLNDAIKSAGGKYFVGNKISVADVVVYNMIESLRSDRMGVTGTVEQYPDLIKFMDGIRQDSPLKAYLDKRPDSI